MFEIEDGGERAGKAGVDGVDRRAAALHLLADALVDQHVLSTAMPTVSTMPAMPGSVNVASSSDSTPKIMPT